MFRYKDANQQDVGPVPKDEIRRLIDAGTITRHTQVRAEESVFWEPASRCAGLVDLFEPKPASPAADSAPSVDSPATPSANDVIEIETETQPEPEPSVQTVPIENPVPPQEPPPRTEPPPRSDSGRFFMIGGDGREYGPITREQLVSWIAQGRANAATKIRREDGKEWAPLGAWPEFADPLKQNEEPRASAPPPLDSARAEQLADELIGNGYSVSLGDCLSRSWQLYQKHFGILTGTTALVIVVVSVVNSFVGAGNLVAAALAGVVIAGLSRVFLKTIRGQSADVNDLVVGFSRSFVPLLVASLLVNILIGVGVFLCFLPGIYLFVAWIFVYPLVLEKGFDFWPAMELSRRIVHERWWEMFALLLVVGLLQVVGLLVGIIGIFVTAPLGFGAIMYAYEDIFSRAPSPTA